MTTNHMKTVTLLTPDTLCTPTSNIFQPIDNVQHNIDNYYHKSLLDKQLRH
jgi:hypothetical protein